jgi:hypothetical protein
VNDSLSEKKEALKSIDVTSMGQSKTTIVKERGEPAVNKKELNVLQYCS